MPRFDTVDRMEIGAPAQTLYDIILDYPRLREWYPRYRIDVIGDGDIQEGTRLAHELSSPGFPRKSRFTRTIQRLSPPTGIEETYDDGDLVGKGRWEFEPLADDRTMVSFYCAVRSNSTIMHVLFALGGEWGHNLTYQSLLAALKERAVGR